MEDLGTLSYFSSFKHWGYHNTTEDNTSLGGTGEVELICEWEVLECKHFGDIHLIRMYVLVNSSHMRLPHYISIRGCLLNCFISICLLKHKICLALLRLANWFLTCLGLVPEACCPCFQQFISWKLIMGSAKIKPWNSVSPWERNSDYHQNQKKTENFTQKEKKQDLALKRSNQFNMGWHE